MTRRPLSRHDWIVAALGALGRGGVAEVRVEVLAKELGATRGSFYWHFADRRELLGAALEEWERQCTTELVARAAEIQDPRARLRFLFTEALADELAAGLEPAIAAHARDPDVARVSRRVADARLAAVAGAFTELGLAPGTARRQAVAAYALLLGWLQLRRAVPDAVPEAAGHGDQSRQALAHAVNLLVGAGNQGDRAR